MISFLAARSRGDTAFCSGSSSENIQTNPKSILASREDIHELNCVIFFDLTNCSSISDHLRIIMHLLKGVSRENVGRQKDTSENNVHIDLV